MSALLPKADMCGATEECPLSANSGHEGLAGTISDEQAVRGRIILISVNSPGWVSTSIKPRVLLDNNVVGDGKTKTRAFSCGFSREERVEHLFFDLRRHTGAVVADSDFHTIAKVFGRGRESRLVVASIISALRLVAA